MCAGSVRAQSTATLMGVDVYRSTQIDSKRIMEMFAPLIRDYVQLKNQRRPTANRRADGLRDRIENLIRGHGKFAYVKMVYTEYFTSARHSGYVTFDLVDAQDVKSRMPFKSAQAASVIDPEGLLEAWNQYAELGADLRNRGELSFGRPNCQAFYCIWGSSTPDLEAYERRFVQFVPPNKKFLWDVLKNEADGFKRAAAVYLLSYLPDGHEVSRAATEALTDADEEVRAAALQVISDLAVYHKTIQLDAARIIPALDFPAVADRSRALGVLVGLVENTVYRPLIIAKASPLLPHLLRLDQPANHDLAYTLLSILSKKNYNRRDYQAWDQWVATQVPPSAHKTQTKP